MELFHLLVTTLIIAGYSCDSYLPHPKYDRHLLLRASPSYSPSIDTLKYYNKEEPKKYDDTMPEFTTSDEYRLNNQIKPYHYILHINLDETGFNGNVRINIQATGRTDSFRIHALSLTLESVKLSNILFGENISVQYVEYPKYEWYEIKTEVRLNESAFYTLEIGYSGKFDSDHPMPSRDGMGIIQQKIDNKPYEYLTYMEPTYARRAFPCFDEPAIKSTFTLSLNHSDTQSAYSNTDIVQTYQVTSNKKVTHFKTTPVMSTYLLAFVVSDYPSKSVDRIKVIASPTILPKLNYFLEISNTELTAFEKLLRVPYGINKLDQFITANGLPCTAMENWGLITHIDLFLQCDQAEDIECELTTASLASHEIAHQWFGNLVTPRWWSDIWLSEGFASYFAYRILDEINPETKAMRIFSQIRQDTFLIDSSDTVPGLVEPIQNLQEFTSLNIPLTYHKGASVVDMFEHALGTKIFLDGIEIYLKNHSHQSVDTNDLWDALHVAVWNINNPLRPNITMHEFGSSWMQHGFPLVNVTFDPRQQSAVLNQVRYLISDDQLQNRMKPSNFVIPIFYLTDSTSLKEAEDPSVKAWLMSDSLSIDRIDATWIIVNNQQHGYYRVNYNKENWMAIAKYLEYENTRNPIIDGVTKSMLIDDSFNLAEIDEITYDIPLQITRSLAGDLDFLVWEAAYPHLVKLLQKLSKTSALENYKLFLEHLICNTFMSGSIGSKASIDETRLKNILLMLSMKSGSKEVSKDAQRFILRKDLVQLSDIETLAVLCGLSRADESFANGMLKGIIPVGPNLKYDPYYVDVTVACTQNHTLVENLVTKMVQMPWFNELVWQYDRKRLFDLYLSHSGRMESIYGDLLDLIASIGSIIGTDGQMHEFKNLGEVRKAQAKDESSKKLVQEAFDLGIQLGEKNIQWNNDHVVDVHHWLEKAVEEFNLV